MSKKIAKHRQQGLSLRTKLKILAAKEKNVSNHELAKQFKKNRATIQTVIRNRDKILAGKKSSKKRSRSYQKSNSKWKIPSNGRRS